MLRNKPIFEPNIAKVFKNALRAFTRASHRDIKSCFTKTRIGHNKNKLKNRDILAQGFRVDIYYSICLVEYPPNPIERCEFKPFWFENQAQLSTHLFGKNFSGLYTTYGDYIVHAGRNCTKFIYWFIYWRSE